MADKVSDSQKTNLVPKTETDSTTYDQMGQPTAAQAPFGSGTRTAFKLPPKHEHEHEHAINPGTSLPLHKEYFRQVSLSKSMATLATPEHESRSAKSTPEILMEINFTNWKEDRFKIAIELLERKLQGSNYDKYKNSLTRLVIDEDSFKTHIFDKLKNHFDTLSDLNSISQSKSNKDILAAAQTTLKLSPERMVSSETVQQYLTHFNSASSVETISDDEKTEELREKIIQYTENVRNPTSINDNNGAPSNKSDEDKIPNSINAGLAIYPADARDDITGQYDWVAKGIHCQDYFSSYEFEDKHIFSVFDGHGPKRKDVVSKEVQAQYPKKLHVLRSKNKELPFEEVAQSAAKQVNDTLPDQGGTTATVCTLEGDTLYTSHCGDSFARLLTFDLAAGSLESTQQLNRYHNINEPDQKSAIESRNGWLTKIGDKERVMGDLEVTTSFGDKHLLDVVYPMMETTHVKLTDLASKAYFVVLGSDGISDSISQTDINGNYSATSD